MRLCAGIPARFPAAIFVVQHLSPSSRSLLPELLSRSGPLPARHPREGEPIQPGQIRVAPPDYHMLLERGRVLLRRGPHENRSRPAVDPLFRSAAVAYGGRVIGVVLTGLLDDGTAGLNAIKRCGGLSVVQDPKDAQWPDMPRHALAHDHVDYRASLADMPDLLGQLVNQPAGLSSPVPRELIFETRIAAREVGMDSSLPLGRPSSLPCPQCGGVLNEVVEQGAARFRCQIGHAFSPETLVAAQNEELERAMEIAMRTQRERVALFRRMQQFASSRSLAKTAEHWKTAAAEAESSARIIAEAIARLKRAEPEQSPLPTSSA